MGRETQGRGRQTVTITNTRWWFEVSSELKCTINLINCLIKHDANISSNAPAEQVQFFFIMHFVIIILHVRSQENVLLYLFRNTFDNSWVNVYWN